MNILAVDTGFAQTKAYTGDKQVIFPTAVSRPSNLDLVDVPDKKASKQYTIGEKTLVVGLDALKVEVSQDFNLEVTDLIDNVPYLVAAAAALAGVDLATVDILALGLPIVDFVKNKVRLLEKMRFFNVNGIDYSPRIVVVPQAVAALQAYHRETAVKDDDEEGAVLDCGGNTVHVLAYCGAEARREGSTQYDKKGVAEAARKVSVLIKKKTGQSCLSEQKFSRIPDISVPKLGAEKRTKHLSESTRTYRLPDDGSVNLKTLVSTNCLFKNAGSNSSTLCRTLAKVVLLYFIPGFNSRQTKNPSSGPRPSSQLSGYPVSSAINSSIARLG